MAQRCYYRYDRDYNSLTPVDRGYNRDARSGKGVATDFFVPMPVPGPFVGSPSLVPQ